jgi:hypothetical protein
MDELEEAIDEIPELSKPISIVNLVKYSKQAYYNGKPEYYDLPTWEQSLSCPTQKKKFKGQRNEKLCGFHRTFVESQHLCVMKAVINCKIEAEIAKKLLKFSRKPVQSNHYGQSTRFPERNRILAQQFTFVTSFAFY